MSIDRHPFVLRSVGRRINITLLVTFRFHSCCLTNRNLTSPFFLFCSIVFRVALSRFLFIKLTHQSFPPSYTTIFIFDLLFFFGPYSLLKGPSYSFYFTFEDYTLIWSYITFFFCVLYCL